MDECRNCKYAICDYEEYYGGKRQWFVEDCRRGCDIDADECDEYEEYGDE